MLSNQLKSSIQQAYSQLLKNKSLKPRAGQKEMIATIARSLAAIESDGDGNRINNAGISVIEAGTGTGKTVAYTLAVLPIAAALKKKVVISTATVALQSQIIHRDLPDIQKHSQLAFNFSLAKGRGRYLCLSQLDRHLQQDLAQEPLFGAESFSPIEQDDQVIVETLAQSLLRGNWSGDRDDWSDEIDDVLWSKLTSDRHMCAGRRCQHVGQCAFFKAREMLTKVDCVVANHDLVMADLALGGGVILPDPSETIYIFDEAHHLPDIALRHFSGQVRIQGSLFWFDQAIKAVATIQKDYASFHALMKPLDELPSLLLEAKTQFTALKPLIEQAIAPLLSSLTEESQNNLPHYRFPKGEVPESMQLIAKSLGQVFASLCVQFESAHQVIDDAMEENSSGLSQDILEWLLTEVGQMLNICQKQWHLWQAYQHQQDDLPDARWIQLLSHNDVIEYELCTSPLLAAQTLSQHLWQKCAGAVLTSATITSLGNFSRIRMQAGLPKWVQTAVVQSPFNYQDNAAFVVPSLQVEPHLTEKHSEEIADHLPKLIQGHLGILVLFSSKRQLNEVYEQVPASFQEKTLAQTQMNKQRLLSRHVEAIDKGKQSIIFGLASLAEGIDLPGTHCTHVVIAKLPFSVPDDPVDSALAEWMEDNGRNPFMEITLPDASRRLIQACGRLIRTEKDKGQITLMDKRVITKRYGRLLLDALPAFRQELG
ncbi:MAG: ATP-dependent DNA helicase DinG [Cellvibrionales bacterium]|nr:ATP-dependent DNA helicase DinG [Cellvibrionales bacterium]